MTFNEVLSGAVRKGLGELYYVLASDGLLLIIALMEGAYGLIVGAAIGIGWSVIYTAIDLSARRAK